MAIPPAPDGALTGPPVLELHGISRRFAGVPALTDADFTLRPGEIHALLGENGAGKTTLMKVAYGLVRPDRGERRVFGVARPEWTPRRAMAAGCSMVQQHFALVPAMTALENVALGVGEPASAALGQRAGTVAASLEFDFDPAAPVATLSIAAQQRIELIKAVLRRSRIIILDEPTSVLAPDDARALFRWVRGFTAEGGAVVLITHRLDDAFEVADHITVLRQGKVALTSPVSATTRGGVVGAMLGTSEALLDADDRGAPRGEGAVVARLSGVRVNGEGTRDRLQDTTLDVSAGQILGVVGVEGAGQRELLRVLAGRLRADAGQVELPNPIAFIPEDRHREALIPALSLVENYALREARQWRGVMPWRSIARDTRDVIARADVRGGSPDGAIETLSGGNQQKFLIGRELNGDPPLIVAENPARGLDLRASAAVYRALRDARDRGAAVVLYGSDLDDVLAVADRVVALFDGRLREVPNEREVVGRAMLGLA